MNVLAHVVATVLAAVVVAAAGVLMHAAEAAAFGHLAMMRVAVKQQQGHSRSATSRCLQMMFWMAPSLFACGGHQPQACCLLSLGG